METVAGEGVTRIEGDITHPVKVTPAEINIQAPARVTPVQARIKDTQAPARIKVRVAQAHIVQVGINPTQVQAIVSHTQALIRKSRAAVQARIEVTQSPADTVQVSRRNIQDQERIMRSLTPAPNPWDIVQRQQLPRSKLRKLIFKLA